MLISWMRTQQAELLTCTEVEQKIAANHFPMICGFIFWRREGFEPPVSRMNTALQRHAALKLHLPNQFMLKTFFDLILHRPPILRIAQ